MGRTTPLRPDRPQSPIPSAGPTTAGAHTPLHSCGVPDRRPRAQRASARAVRHPCGRGARGLSFRGGSSGLDLRSCWSSQAGARRQGFETLAPQRGAAALRQMPAVAGPARGGRPVQTASSSRCRAVAAAPARTGTRGSGTQRARDTRRLVASEPPIRATTPSPSASTPCIRSSAAPGRSRTPAARPTVARRAPRPTGPRSAHR
jgi:hypothetical protein